MRNKLTDIARHTSLQDILPDLLTITLPFIIWLLVVYLRDGSLLGAAASPTEWTFASLLLSILCALRVMRVAGMELTIPFTQTAILAILLIMIFLVVPSTITYGQAIYVTGTKDATSSEIRLFGFRGILTMINVIMYILVGAWVSYVEKKYKKPNKSLPVTPSAASPSAASPSAASPSAASPSAASPSAASPSAGVSKP